MNYETKEDWIKDINQHTKEIKELEAKLSIRNRPIDIVEDILMTKIEKFDAFIDGYMKFIEKNEKQPK